MTPERWRQISTLYQAALDHTPGERAAFLNDACNGDSGLRRQVEVLIKENTGPDGILDKPAWDSLPSSGLPLATGAQLGPYKIETIIGKGGMGAVYLARHAMLDKLVAMIEEKAAHLEALKAEQPAGPERVPRRTAASS